MRGEFDPNAISCGYCKSAVVYGMDGEVCCPGCGVVCGFAQPEYVRGVDEVGTGYVPAGLRRYVRQGKSTALAKNVTRLAERLHLTRLSRVEAISIARKLDGMKFARGRHMDALAAACVYVAARSCGRTIDIKDMDVQKRAVSRYVRDIMVLFRVGQEADPVPNIITRTCAELRMHSRRAASIYGMIRDGRAALGKNPRTVAALCVHLAGGRIGAASRTAGVSPGSVRRIKSAFALDEMERLLRGSE